MNASSVISLKFKSFSKSSNTDISFLLINVRILRFKIKLDSRNELHIRFDHFILGHELDSDTSRVVNINQVIHHLWP